jgi:hypothetical protein
MKLAFARTGAPHRHAFWNLASFSAKRLSLVEQPQMNGLNKELKRLAPIFSAASQPFVNHDWQHGDFLAQNAGRFARRETIARGHREAFACVRREKQKVRSERDPIQTNRIVLL